MNQLIAGGLLVLGVLFLVALVFVIRSEPATQESADVPPPVPTEQEEPKIQSTTDEASSTIEAPFTPGENALLPVTENHAVTEWYPLADGQFYEMVNELRSMRNQAQELEHRLSALIDMAQRVEQTQNGYFPIEEQVSPEAQVIR